MEEMVGEEVTRVSTDVYNLEKLLASTSMVLLLLFALMFVIGCTVALPLCADALGWWWSLTRLRLVPLASCTFPGLRPPPICFTLGR